MSRTRVFALFLGLMLGCTAWAEDIPRYQATLLKVFTTFDARQGVAVDDRYFYAVNNTRITRHDKKTGEALLQWDGGADNGGLLLHLDGAVIVAGKLYAAHSNYPQSPMTSSIEIWDSATLEHVGSHSFGEYPGSLTWIDYHGGYWWAGFGNYDKIQSGDTEPYGTTAATRLVKMNDDFVVLQQWLYPKALHERFTPMSNSGGSWGPDGLLYITGHDHPEVYVVQLPQQGSEVQWLATVELPQIEGQGIAWDRTAATPILWGILKRDSKVFSFAMPRITGTAKAAMPDPLRKPGAFNRN